jgi:hypothetical protein
MHDDVNPIVIHGYIDNGSRNIKRSGTEEKYYGIRAVPGAGKNFLGSLLWELYNKNDLTTMHYSEIFNEYFTSVDVIKDPAGDHSIPYWKNDHWKFINIRRKLVSDNYITIQHEHEWFSGAKSRREKANKIDASVGINMANIPKALISGYYITTDTPEEIEFVYKLFYIKRTFGDRPNIIYNKDNSSLSYSNEVNRLICPVGSPEELNDFTFKDIKLLISDWINFTKFIKNEDPEFYPFSKFNLIYFKEYLKREKVKYLNPGEYLRFYELFKNNSSRFGVMSNYTPELNSKKMESYFEFEKNHLKEFKEKIENLKVISYKDLFINYTDTNTPFDQYKDRIKEYTRKNIALIKKYEDYFGKIVI